MPQEILSPQDQQQIVRLLWRLGGRHSADRWTAQTELRKMPPIPLPLLLAVMVRLARVRRQAPFLLFLGLLAATFLLLGLLLIFDSRYGRSSHLPTLAAGVAGIVLMVRRWLLMRDAAIRALAGYNDVRAVGPLIEALQGEQTDRETRKVARELLLHLLPRVQPQNADLLTASQQEALRNLRNHGEDPELQAAAAGCLEVISARRTRERLRGNLLRVIDGNPNSTHNSTQGEDH
jgi:HEAT repeat protein